MPPLNAVLAKLSIATFTNSRQDKAITNEVRAAKALGEGAGQWRRFKLPKEALEPISEHIGVIRRYHYEHTSPWEEGSRLLSGAALPGYQAAIEDHKRSLFELVDEFGKHYPDWLIQARVMHGKTFEASDYPLNWAGMRACFNVKAEYSPIPSARSFQVHGIAQATLHEMQEQLEGRVQERVRQATADTWQRLLEPLQNMADVMSRNDPRVFDTIITNITSMCELVPTLDVSNSAALRNAAVAIQGQIRRIDIEGLRESRSARREAAQTARQLIAQFGQVGQRKLAA